MCRKKKKEQTFFLKCVFHSHCSSVVSLDIGDWSSYLRLSSSRYGSGTVFLCFSSMVSVQQLSGASKVKREVGPRCHCLSRRSSQEKLLLGIVADLCSGPVNCLWASEDDSNSDVVHPVRLAGEFPAPG